MRKMTEKALIHDGDGVGLGFSLPTIRKYEGNGRFGVLFFVSQ